MQVCMPHCVAAEGCFTGEPIFIARDCLTLEKELQKAAAGHSGLSPDAGRGAAYAEDEGCVPPGK